MTDRITFAVDADVARAYRAASEGDRRKLDLLVNLRLREATRTRQSLREVMEQISRNAQERGLTPEILRSIGDRGSDMRTGESGTDPPEQARRGAPPTELWTIPSATANEIDMEAFDSFTRARGRQAEAGPRPGTDDDLRDAQVCEELDGVLRPTLYGLVVFGRGPQRYRPALRMFVHCARYAGLDRAARPISVGEAKGRLEDQVDRAMGWFRSLGRREEYHGILREDIPLMPELVLCEALVNAVVHRDYAEHGTQILLEVFSDRIEVTSPGALPGDMTVAEAVGGGAPGARNERMAKAMVVRRRMGLRGRGWPGMRRGMREFNGTEPELINEVRHRYVRVRFRTPLETETGGDG